MKSLPLFPPSAWKADTGGWWHTCKSEALTPNQSIRIQGEIHLRLQEALHFSFHFKSLSIWPNQFVQVTSELDPSAPSLSMTLSRQLLLEFPLQKSKTVLYRVEARRVSREQEGLQFLLLQESLVHIGRMHCGFIRHNHQVYFLCPQVSTYLPVHRKCGSHPAPADKFPRAGG